VHVLHRNLEAVEASRLRDLHLTAELLGQVFEDDAVRGCEEGQDIFDEVLLLGVEFLPVSQVLVEIDLVDRPEGGEVFLVHVVDGGVVDGEEDEAVRVFLEDGLWLFLGGEGVKH
jgi:hypothetical protein